MTERLHADNPTFEQIIAERDAWKAACEKAERQREGFVAECLKGQHAITALNALLIICKRCDAKKFGVMHAVIVAIVEFGLESGDSH